MAKQLEIPILAMYSTELYVAALNYASKPDDRSQYDALVEAATATANAWLARNRKEDA